MRDLVVAVSAVDVEQVDRAVGERRRRVVERPLEEGRERSVSRVVVLAELLEHLGAVPPCVLVALPGVHGVAAGRQPERLTAWQKPQYESPFHVPSSTSTAGRRTATAKNANGRCSCQLSTSVSRQRLVEDDGVTERLEGHRRACARVRTIAAESRRADPGDRRQGNLARPGAPAARYARHSASPRSRPVSGASVRAVTTRRRRRAGRRRRSGGAGDAAAGDDRVLGEHPDPVSPDESVLARTSRDRGSTSAGDGAIARGASRQRQPAARARHARSASSR